MYLYVYGLCTTISFTIPSGALVLDPTLKEDAVCDGKICIAMNTHHEVCLLRKLGALAVAPKQVHER